MSARVLVNRLWRLLFGEGLVRTAADLGTQGTPPTHPELLDWLAVELVDSGWNVKHVMKLMVMSRTYQQTFAGHRRTGPCRSGELLARPARPLPPGRGICPRQRPGDQRPLVAADGRTAGQALSAGRILELSQFSGAGVAERSRREPVSTRAVHFLVADVPPTEFAGLRRLHAARRASPERPRSNTPLQALVLLNDPTYVEAAKMFAARIVRDGGRTEAERLRYAYHRALQRNPTAAEAVLLEGLYRRHFAEYQADPKAAAALLTVGDAKPPAGMNPAELAAWTSVARVVLNLHETITRD